MSARPERAPEASSDKLDARLRALLAGMLDPVVTIDARGIVQDASASVLPVFGWNPEELVGRNVSVLMGEPHRSLHDGYLARYRETGQTNILGRTREFEVVRKDGAHLVCDVSISRVDVPGDPEPLFIGSFRDVTAQRRAEHELAERERRFHAIFDQEFQFVGLLNPAGEILEMNRAALAAAGVERAGVVGKLFWDVPWLETDAGRALVEKSIADAARGEFVRFETTMRGAGGRPITVDFSVKPVLDERGRVVMLLPEGRDVTVIKDAQRRETAVLKALATIGESASILVHEIKNPITGIHLAIQAVADQLGEDHREILHGLEASLQKVERTMRRTLSFAKPLDLRRQPVVPARLLESVARNTRAEFPRSKAALQIECAEGLPTVDADPALLEEVLLNLVKNAIEALEDGGTVRLSARRSEAHGLELRVEDDGPGIPDYVLPNLFKPFFTTKETGTGIGLALCKKIVEQHGGTIHATRGALGGATFEILIPSGARGRGALGPSA